MSSSIVPADNFSNSQNYEVLHHQEAVPATQTRVEDDDKQQGIHKLPNEILIYLFKFVHEMASPAHTRQIASDMSQRAELKIASVCRTWRVLALAQSDLWTTLCVPITKEIKNRGLAVTMYLQRSKAQLLYVWFTVYHKMLPTAITMILDILSHHSNRMRHIGFFFDNRAVKRTIPKKIMQWNLKSLESLELHFDAGDWQPLPQCDITVEYLQQLKYLRAPATTFFTSDRLIFFPRLTVLYLESYGRHNTRVYKSSFSHIMDLPNLITLSVRGHIFRYSDEIRPVLQIVAQNLRNFRCGDPSAIRWMWRDVAFPNLELLVLEDPFFDNIQYPFDINADRGDQSLPILAPKLHTLVLTECVMGKSIAFEKAFASATVAARHLVIIDLSKYRAMGWGVLFSRLSSNTEPSRFLWPNLETITYRASSIHARYYNPVDYRNASESRSHAGKQCKIRCSFELVDGKDCYEVDPERYSEWIELHEAGIVEDVPWGDAVVPWPHEDNFFSGQAEDYFTS